MINLEQLCLTKNKLTTSYLLLFGTLDKYYFEAVEGNLPQ